MKVLRDLVARLGRSANPAPQSTQVARKSAAPAPKPTPQIHEVAYQFPQDCVIASGSHHESSQAREVARGTTTLRIPRASAHAFMSGADDVRRSVTLRSGLKLDCDLLKETLTISLAAAGAPAVTLPGVKMVVDEAVGEIILYGTEQYHQTEIDLDSRTHYADQFYHMALSQDKSTPTQIIHANGSYDWTDDREGTNRVGTTGKVRTTYVTDRGHPLQVPSSERRDGSIVGHYSQVTRYPDIVSRPFVTRKQIVGDAD